MGSVTDKTSDTEAYVGSVRDEISVSPTPMLSGPWMGSVTDETSDMAATKLLSFESTYAMHAHSRVSDNLNTSMKARNEQQYTPIFDLGNFEVEIPRNYQFKIFFFFVKSVQKL